MFSKESQEFTPLLMITLGLGQGINIIEPNTT
jgi:hypothetical protein